MSGVNYDASLGGRRAQETSSTSTAAVDLAAWRAAAMTAVLTLVLVWIAAAVVYRMWHRRRKADKLEAHSGEREAFAGNDLECGKPSLSKAAQNGHAYIANGDEALHKQPVNGEISTELCDALRELLKQEVTRGLTLEGVTERLAILEQDEQANGCSNPQQVQMDLRSAACDLNDEALPFPRSPLVASCSPAPPAGEPPMPGMLKKRAPFKEVKEAGTSTDRDFLNDFGQTPTRRRLRGHSINAAFGPTSRQNRLPEPPEKANFGLEEISSLKLSIGTMQRQLNRRDSQSQELRRQIEDCQQVLQAQTEVAQVAVGRLQDLRSNPSSAPTVQDNELKKLQGEQVQMSARLETSQKSERHWAHLAKSQRTYFMQTERLQSEGYLPIKQHPAGELALAPAPITLEGDDCDMKNPPWDVGTSHMNPYVVDSWPFEPNVQAQRCAVEPNLNRLDEVDEELLADDSDEEEQELDEEQHFLHAHGGTSPSNDFGDTLDGDDEVEEDDGEELGKDEMCDYLAADQPLHLPQPPPEADDQDLVTTDDLGSESSRSH